MDSTPTLYRSVIDEVLTEMKRQLEQYGWDDDTVAAKMHKMQLVRHTYCNAGTAVWR